MSYVYILARAPRTLIFVLCLVGVQRVEGVLKVTGRCQEGVRNVLARSSQDRCNQDRSSQEG